MQHFFVNGRWVRDRLFTAALRAAYRGYLIPGKHPLAYLFFEFPADAGDVNVHPTKSEVRFRNPGLMYPLVFNVVSRVLEPAAGENPDPGASEAPGEGGELQDRAEQAGLDFLSRPSASSAGETGQGPAGGGWSGVLVAGNRDRQKGQGEC